MRGRRRLILAGLILAVVAFFTGLQFRSGRLELYTSPVLRVAAKSYRVQVLIPSGWSVEARQVTPGALQSAQSFLTIRKTHPFDWLRGWLGHSREEPELRDQMLVDLRPRSAVENRAAKVDPNTTQFIVADPDFCVGRALTIGDIFVYVEYLRSDRSQFEATYRQIMDSIKVLP